MDAEYHGIQQGSSSCHAAACGVVSPSRQEKRQRCQVQGSSSDQVGSSANDSLEITEPEQQDLDYGEQDEEDYYMDDDDFYQGDSDGDDFGYDFDDFNQQLADKFDDLDLPPGVEATVPWLQQIATNKEQNRVPSEKKVEDEISRKYKSFEQFYNVQNFSDHQFTDKSVGKTSREWAKRIQHDWKLLEKDLPASIYVRVAEDRMDLLRAAIVGPKGTPYHDGLFFFDVQFTSSYPSQPPLVHYHAGGLRINPNLYACGKVCLSLLGTWGGSGCEKWNPAQSTMLQVLVSIQALILNEKPYFNEPGYASYANSLSGENNSIEYNKTAFLHSCRTMLYSLRRPPEHFADLVAGHFREYGHTILAACKHYMQGNLVGSVVPEEVGESGNKRAVASSSSNAVASSSTAVASSSSNAVASSSSNVVQKIYVKPLQFSTNLKTLFEDLLMEFNVKGADTRKFIKEKLQKDLPAAI